MSISKRIFLPIPLLFGLLSCQVASRLLPPTPVDTVSQEGSPTNQVLLSPAPLNPQPDSQLTATPTLIITPTSFPPFPSPTSPATPDVQITPSVLQLQIFEELWQIINEEYLYADFNGLDWEAIHQEYRSRLEKGMSDEEFYQAMDEMVFRLGDEHSVFLDPQEAAEEDAQYAGNNDYVGVGILVTAVPERKRGVILVIFPGSPAELAGLKPHDSILLVDSQPLLDDEGYLRDIIRGPEGSSVTLTVQSPGKEVHEITLERRRIVGSLPIYYSMFSTSNNKQVGYILLVTFADNTVDDQVEAAIRDLTSDGPLDGLILDNRHNEGGVDTEMRNILALFTNGTLGYFVSRNQEHPLQIKGRDINGSQDIPLVVFIDTDTVSFGEVFSGVLKDTGRAYLIGERTEGNVEILWGYDFEDGSRAWIAKETFRPFNHPEADWETLGIWPDLEIETGWDMYTLDNDPAIQAALAYFDSQ